MKYVNPSVVGNVFIGRPGETTYGSNSLYGAWSLTGKELLAPRYSGINGSGEFIYATSADQKQTDVYNLQMKKLNPKTDGCFTTRTPKWIGLFFDLGQGGTDVVAGIFENHLETFFRLRRIEDGAGEVEGDFLVGGDRGTMASTKQVPFSSSSSLPAFFHLVAPHSRERSWLIK